MRRFFVCRTALAGLCLLLVAWPVLADPLPSWRDGAAKSKIIAFVDAVTDPGSTDFVPVAARIATFDNDGTLWAEQPAYFQLIYALDEVRAAAKADPAYAATPALKAAVEGDLKPLFDDHHKGLMEVIDATHSGMTVSAYTASVRKWLETARHSQSGQPYDAMVYQPMLELLRYLRDEGFSTYIVSGGGIHFIRVFAEPRYGIPPQQVVGSMGNERFEIRDGKPVLIKEAGLFFVDDKSGKPVAIDRHIGRRPIFVGGNSDGDLQMLQWSTAGDGPRFGLIVHHDDGEREWAYDRDSAIGRLDKAMDLAPKEGWLLVSMKDDWAKVFPWQK
ncbi:MAG: HAD family hydrolase [Kiloniellales bacterium]